MIRIAVCDDEEKYLDVSRNMLERYAEANPERTLRISCFHSGRDLVSSVVMNGAYDVYILDVIMPELSGIDTGVAIRRHDEAGKIIYLTSSPDYAVDSYITSAYYYLLKPVDEAKLHSVLSGAITQILERREKCVKVKTADETVMIPFDSIVYVELRRKALEYHLVDGSVVKSLSQRESFANCVSILLGDSRFMLSGAGTCLNLHRIKAVERDSVTFRSGEKYYIPRSSAGEVKDAWLDYWFNDQ